VWCSVSLRNGVGFWEVKNKKGVEEVQIQLENVKWKQRPLIHRSGCVWGHVR